VRGLITLGCRHRAKLGYARCHSASQRGFFVVFDV
jgi:hypothetical protein